MKEKIFNALKTKYSNLGLSDDQLNLVADMYGQIVTDESQIDTAIAGAEGTLQSMQSQGDALRTVQADLEKLKTPTPPTPPTPPASVTPPSGTDPELMKVIATLTEKVNGFEQSREKDMLQTQKDAMIANAKAKMLADGATPKLADKVLAGINIQEGATVETIHETGMRDYNFFKSNFAPEAGPSGGPTGNPDGTVTKSVRDDYFAERKAKAESQLKE